MKCKRAKVFFKYLPNDFGQSWPGEICVDLKYGNPIRTYLHEQLHLLHPGWSETRVRKEELKKWRRMTQKEVFYLAKRMFSRKWKVENVS